MKGICEGLPYLAAPLAQRRWHRGLRGLRGLHISHRCTFGHSCRTAPSTAGASGSLLCAGSLAHSTWTSLEATEGLRLEPGVPGLRLGPGELRTEVRSCRQLGYVMGSNGTVPLRRQQRPARLALADPHRTPYGCGCEPRRPPQL